ncbi:hypothetical protein Bbelb_018810 [Branchiostoma belcheri]|nr:hypothetical protein Bbelb_018810 [Branchiostoma belcheri]
MNVDASPVRGEYKCETYRLYVRSVIRYILTVHDVIRTHQQELSHSVTQYLKKWTNLKKSSDSGDDSVQDALQAKVEGNRPFNGSKQDLSLTDGYTWRHNSVLKELVTTLQGWYSTLEAAVTKRHLLSEMSAHVTNPSYFISFVKLGDREKVAGLAYNPSRQYQRAARVGNHAKSTLRFSTQTVFREVDARKEKAGRK